MARITEEGILHLGGLIPWEQVERITIWHTAGYDSLTFQVVSKDFRDTINPNLDDVARSKRVVLEKLPPEKVEDHSGWSDYWFYRSTLVGRRLHRILFLWVVIGWAIGIVVLVSRWLFGR